MIKTIIFDLGNVIVNVDKDEFGRFSADSRKSIPYVGEYFENSSSRKAFERGEIQPEQFYRKTAEELSLNMNFNEFKRMWCDIFALNKDVANLIRKLKRNYRLILLSNTDELHFEHIKNRYKVIDIFDAHVLSYKVGYSKPNPLIFLNALRKAKTLPFNCLYFDDIPQFVYVARLMGIRAFQYTTTDKMVSDLNKAKVKIN